MSTSVVESTDKLLAKLDGSGKAEPNETSVVESIVVVELADSFEDKVVDKTETVLVGSLTLVLAAVTIPEVTG